MFGEHRRAVIGNDANQPVARHFISDSVTVTVFQINKFEPSVLFLGAMIAAKTRNAPYFQTWHCPLLGINERFSYV
jgi:hypothetical protein